MRQILIEGDETVDISRLKVITTDRDPVKAYFVDRTRQSSPEIVHTEPNPNYVHEVYASVHGSRLLNSLAEQLLRVHERCLSTNESKPRDVLAMAGALTELQRRCAFVARELSQLHEPHGQDPPAGEDLDTHARQEGEAVQDLKPNQRPRPRLHAADG